MYFTLICVQCNDSLIQTFRLSSKQKCLLPKAVRISDNAHKYWCMHVPCYDVLQTVCVSIQSPVAVASPLSFGPVLWCQVAHELLHGKRLVVPLHCLHFKPLTKWYVSLKEETHSSSSVGPVPQDMVYLIISYVHYVHMTSMVVLLVFGWGAWQRIGLPKSGMLDFQIDLRGRRYS